MQGHDSMNWKIVGIVLLVLIIGLAAAMIRQHERYLDARRNLVQDYQNPWHGDVFHVLTYLSIGEDSELIPVLRNLSAAAAEEGNSQLIYAGKVIHVGIVSPQLVEATGRGARWHAILVQQFEDRVAFDAYREHSAVERALGEFAGRFFIGMRRSAGLNLALPQVLLMMKLARTVTSSTDKRPFTDVNEPLGPGFQAIEGPLIAEADGLAKHAIMIVNLRLSGDQAQQRSDNRYAFSMMELMADRGYGPMHLGDPLAIDHQLDYDMITMVFYPGSGYFRDLLFSTWYQSIFGNKQLADAQSTVTAPITDLL